MTNWKAFRCSRIQAASLLTVVILPGSHLCRAQQPPADTPTTRQTPIQSADLQPGASGVDEGLKYLRSNQPEKALAVFRKVLESDPEIATANLYAASAALYAYQGEAAVAYAEKARQLAPNAWQVDTTLVAAYAAAGRIKERDAARARLIALHANANAPDAIKANGFLLDIFRVKDYRVEVIQYFKPLGKFHTYYRFVVRNRANRQLWVYELQSDDFEQKSWAAAHPQEAAAGGRQYSLESDTADTHTEYRLFSGDPGYDAVREVVVRLLLDRTTPFPAELPKPPSAVQ